MRAHTRASAGEARLLVLLAFLLYFVFLTRSYLPFFSDDALISLRYSHRLLTGHGLTFNTGERVEGYSNLLWVLMVAAGGLFNSDLIAVARVLGLICTIAALVIVVALAGARDRGSFWAAAIGVAALAMSHSVAIWTVGGLEQPLHLALLVAALALAVHSISFGPGTTGLLGSMLALLALTRPDGVLFAVAISFGLLLAHGTSRATIRAAGTVLGIALLAWAGQLAFRLWYYGDWVPNTAHVKLAWSAHHAIDGLSYLGSGAIAHAPIILLAAAVLATTRPFRSPVTLIPISAALLWCGYVGAVGGDIFPGHRFFLPVAAAAAVALSAAWSRSFFGRLPFAVQGAVIIATLVPYALVQASDSEDIRAHDELWEWDCRTLAAELRTAFEGASPLIAADPVGCIGYFGDMATLDLNGLNDSHIGRTRPAGFGQGWIGHEAGDGAYALSRRPDLVLLCNPYGSATGCFPSGTEMIADPEFRKFYVPTTIAAEGRLFPTLLWVRTDSRAAGVRSSADTFHLPGLFFAADKQTAAILSGGRFLTHIPPNGVAHFDSVPENIRSWIPHAVASAPVDISFQGQTVSIAAGAAGVDLAEVVFSKPTN